MKELNTATNLNRTVKDMKVTNILRAKLVRKVPSNKLSIYFAR